MTIWVERLTLPGLALLSLESALTGARVLYDRHNVTPAAARALALLRLPLRPAALSLAGREPSGAARNYRMVEQLQACVDGLVQDQFPGAPDWQLQAVRCYLSGQLAHRVTFMVMAEAAAGGRRNVLRLSRHPANEALRFFALKPGFSLREAGDWRGWAKTLLKPLRLLARCAAPKPTRTTRAEPRPSVWVEYFPADLDSFISRAFWKPHVRGDAFDVVFYLDRSDCRWSDQEAARIVSKGFQAVDLAEPASAARLRASDLRQLAALLLAKPAGRRLWLQAFLVELETTRRIWASLAGRFRVKLLVQHQEFSWKQAAQARGLEDAGGAMLGVHWSNFPYFVEPGHISPQHVFFVWGEWSRLWLEGKGHGCRHVLPCGVWITPDREHAARLRPEGFTLAVFDSSVAYNIYQTAEQLAAFIDAVLDLGERHPQWTVLAKLKTGQDWSALPGATARAARLEALRAARRWRDVAPTVSPPTVAAAADLSVCFGFNSAGVVAAAFGARAVHWDCSGWLEHPLYAEPAQKVLYPDLTALSAAVEAAAAGDASVGDFSRWAPLVNAFGDDKAAGRVGGFVQDFMDRVAAGAPGLRALDEAAAAYRRQHERGALRSA